MYVIKCAEVWSGIKNEDVDACSQTVTASLFSSSADGTRGGDIYFFSVCGSDLLTRIVIADVKGHGDAVSDISRWIFEQLKEHMNDLDDHEILGEVNRQATARGLESMTTAAIMSVYSATGKAYFSYAGHEPILHKHFDQDTWTALERDDKTRSPSNMPLGVVNDVVFDRFEFPVSKGDRLLMYTDGVIEAPSPDGELFGRSRLLSALNRYGSSSLADGKRGVLTALSDHTGRRFDHDDVTLLAIEVR
jgi:phosphoserine phosphatase RsbU/P